MSEGVEANGSARVDVDPTAFPRAVYTGRREEARIALAGSAGGAALGLVVGNGTAGEDE